MLMHGHHQPPKPNWVKGPVVKAFGKRTSPSEGTEQEEQAVTALLTPSKQVVFGSPSRRRQPGAQSLAVVSDAYPWLLVYLKELVSRLPDVKVPAKAIQLGFVTSEQLKQVVRQLSEDEVLYFNKHADEALQVAMGTCKGQDQAPSTAMLDDYMLKLKSRRYKQDEDWRAPSRLSNIRQPGQQPAQQEAEPAYTFIFEEHSRRMTAAALIQRKWRAWRQYCTECGRPLQALRWDLRRVQVDLRNAYAMANPGRTRAQRFLTDQEYKAKYQMLTTAETIMTRLLQRHHKEQNVQEDAETHLKGMRDDLQQLSSMIKQATIGLEDAGLSSPHHRASDSGTSARSRRGSMMGGTESGRPKRRISFTNGTSEDSHSPSAEAGRHTPGRSRFGGLSESVALSTRIRAELQSGSGVQFPAGDSESDSEDDSELPSVNSTGKLILDNSMTPMEKAKRVAASMLQYLGPTLQRPVADLSDQALRHGNSNSRPSTPGSARPSTAGALDEEQGKRDVATNATAVKAEAKQVLRDLLFDKPHGHSLALLDRVSSSMDKEELARRVQHEVARINQTAQTAKQPSGHSATSPLGSPGRPKSQGSALKLKKAEMLQALRTSAPPSPLKSPKQSSVGPSALVTARNPLSKEPSVVRLDIQSQVQAHVPSMLVAAPSALMGLQPRQLLDHRLNVHSDPGVQQDLQAHPITIQHHTHSPPHSPTRPHMLPGLQRRLSKQHSPSRSGSPPKQHSPARLQSKPSDVPPLLLPGSQQPIDLVISPFQVPENAGSAPPSPTREWSISQLAAQSSQAQLAAIQMGNLQELVALSLTTKQLLPQQSAQQQQQQQGTTEQQPSSQHPQLQQQGQQQGPLQAQQQQQQALPAAEPHAAKASSPRRVTPQEVVGLAEPALLSPATSYQPQLQVQRKSSYTLQSPHMQEAPTQASYQLTRPSHVHISAPPPPGLSPAQLLSPSAMSPKPFTKPLLQAERLQPLMLGALPSEGSGLHVGLAPKPEASGASVSSLDRFASQLRQELEHMKPLHLDACPQPASTIQPFIQKLQAPLQASKSDVHVAGPPAMRAESSCPIIAPSAQPQSQVAVMALQAAVVAGDTPELAQFRATLLASEKPAHPHPHPNAGMHSCLQQEGSLASAQPSQPAGLFVGKPVHSVSQDTVPSPARRISGNGGAKLSPTMALAASAFPQPHLKSRAFTLKLAGRGVTRSLSGVSDFQSGRSLARNGSSGYVPGEYDPEPLTDEEEDLAVFTAARPRSTHFTRRMRDQNRPAPQPGGSTLNPPAPHSQHSPEHRSSVTSLLLPPLHALLSGMPVQNSSTTMTSGFRASCSEVGLACEHSCSSVHTTAKPAKVPMLRAASLQELYTSAIPTVGHPANSVATGALGDKAGRPGTPSMSCKATPCSPGRLLVVPPVVPGAAKLVVSDTGQHQGSTGTGVHLPKLIPAGAPGQDNGHVGEKSNAEMAGSNLNSTMRSRGMA